MFRIKFFYNKVQKYYMAEKALIEAALFVSDKPLTIEKLAAMVKMDGDEVKTFFLSFTSQPT